MTPGLVLLVLSQALAVDAAHPITRRAASTVVSSMRRCGMKRLALVLVVLVSACASPEVDRAAPAFDAQVYATDLDACRGGPDSAVALESFTQFVQGALIGTYHGLVAGAVSGDAPESMAVGAVIGAVIGLGTGGSKALDARNAAVKGCLRSKGYTVLAVQSVSETVSP